MARQGLILLLSCVLWSVGPAFAKEAVPAAADPALETRLHSITSELRCLVCQNETIAGSRSGLADDLRREVREQLQRGASDEQVVQFMTDRYGDFVRYRPAFKASTAVLWIGPAALLAIGLGGLAFALWRRSKLAPDQFEPDVDVDAMPNEVDSRPAGDRAP